MVGVCTVVQMVFAKYMTYIGSTMIAESYTGGFRIGSLIDETNIIKSTDLWATGFRRLMNGIYSFGLKI